MLRRESPAVAQGSRLLMSSDDSGGWQERTQTVGPSPLACDAEGYEPSIGPSKWRTSA